MNDFDYTLTSPLSHGARAASPLLCLTIVWHPDLRRIGEQVCATGAVFELSRNAPLFQRLGQGLNALGYGGVSREGLQIVRDAEDGLEIRPPASRMAVELNGTEIHHATRLSREQVAAGAVLGLGRAVLLCLHWMRCLPKDNPVPGLVGVGMASIETRDLIRQVAPTDSAVLLLGETGSGKEVVARAVHALSRRRDQRLVTVNMAALNEALAAADLFGAAKGAYTGAQNARAGLFAEAQDATLFLDEIGNTPAVVQPMLLRVLETGDYRPLGAATDRRSSARLIAATDQDLYGDAFNQALLRRLESFVIRVAPLRARREDIGLLLLHVLGPGAKAASFPASLVSKFANYDWPGNVRQLKHLARRCALALEAGDMPDFDSLLDVRASTSAAGAAEPAAAADSAPPRKRKPAHLSEADVLAAMKNNDWYIQGAAKELGISRPSLYKLIETHSQIRRADQISHAQIAEALALSGGDLEGCAAQLQTPSEALRRYLRGAGLLR